MFLEFVVLCFISSIVAKRLAVKNVCCVVFCCVVLSKFLHPDVSSRSMLVALLLCGFTVWYVGCCFV